MKKNIYPLLLFLIFCLESSWFSSAHEVSKAGIIFDQVKDGVVTLFTSAGHGSGFLMDSSGLILTNSHVVKEAGSNLRVKFGPNEIIQGQVIENDRENDIAVVRVNLEHIKTYKILTPFTPYAGDSLVLIGEHVLAVGSPLQRETLEKTLTAGIIGKFNHDVIHHDAAINPGNSGGPLFNYNANVVGINTFITQENYGPGISGAVPITKALPVLEKARQDAIKQAKPSGELLPDMPTIAYPISQFLKENPNLFPKRNPREYNFEASYFKVSVLTPPQGYRQIVKIQDEELAKRKKRAQKKGFEITDDEYNYKNLKYYDYNKPLVTLMVIPRPKLTTGSKIINTISFLAAVGATAASYGASAPSLISPFVMGKTEVKKDFLSMSLVTPDGKVACSPVETGRIPFQKNLIGLSGYAYQDFVDKSYIGLYSYDSKCFENSQPLKLMIDIEGTKDNDYNISIPDRIKKLVVEDFKPYAAYVAQLSPTQDKR